MTRSTTSSTMTRSTPRATSQTTSRTKTGPFGPADLAMLRGLLEQQRAFRIDQLSQLDRVNPPGPLSSEDPEVAFSLANGARAALRDVQLALWRMDDGNYGRCTGCGGWLEKGRLHILPQIALCLDCRPPGVHR